MPIELPVTPPQEASKPTEYQGTSQNSFLFGRNGVKINKEPCASFNYQRFLTMLKNPEARDIVTQIRKFIENFKGRDSENLSLVEQVSNYRAFRNRLAEEVIMDHPLWISAGVEEQENAIEGVEYIIMNQIHAKAFCPKHSDDKERDEAVYKKMCLYDWLELKHLDVKASQQPDEVLFKRAIEEIQTIDNYTTPRDKLIALMNSCKFLERSMPEGNRNADSFMPILILALIMAAPKHLYSNLYYISRFRNSKLMIHETAYQFTNLMAAMTFIEKLDRAALVIGDGGYYDTMMEASVARFNAASIAQQEEDEMLHHAEMARREAEMLAKDNERIRTQYVEEPDQKLETGSKKLMGKIKESEFVGKLKESELVGRIKEADLMGKLKEADLMGKSKNLFSKLKTETETAVKTLLDDESDEDDVAAARKAKREQELAQEEEYQLNLALALSLSEAEATKGKGKAEPGSEQLLQ